MAFRATLTSDARPVGFDLDRAASALLAARRTRRWLEALPEGARPITAAQAYAIQDRVAARLGPVGGWKVGAATPTSEPFRAPIPAGAVFNGTAMPAAALHVIGVEAELAYRIDRDLPRRARPYGQEEGADAVGAIHPAIEIVDTRYAAFGALDRLSHLADHQNGGALALGPALEGWRGVVPIEQPVSLWIDGALRHEGRGGNSAGDPLRLLVWLANGGAGAAGLRAGQVVTSGSVSGTVLVDPGVKVQAAFDGVGAVEIDIA